MLRLKGIQEQNINLIVVKSIMGNSGIKKMLLESVTSELVTYAACLVLGVK
jgi:nucleotide-binding universal stress UspA family protein